MAYNCYLCGELMPITPAKLSVKIKGQNKTITLLNEGEINFLKAPGLTEINVTLIFPMLTSKNKPDYYLGLLEKYKVKKKTTQFKLLRATPDNKQLFDTDIKVSVEDYEVKEDATKGLDVVVDVKLLQYRDYGTKKVSLKQITETGKQAMTIEQERETSNAPTATKYTVKKNESLWKIAGEKLGDPNRWREIYELNKDKISDPNLVKKGWDLVLPER